MYRDETGQPLPDLPDAPNCRCMTIPVLQMPEEFRRNPAARALFQTATGKLIPDPAGYEDWWAGAAERERMTAVGVRRYQTVRDRLARLPEPRKPEWADFIDAEGRLLPVETLAQESPQERDQRRRQVDLVLAQRRELFRRAASSGFVGPPTPGSPQEWIFQGPEAIQKAIQHQVEQYKAHFRIPPEERSRQRHFAKTQHPASEIRAELLRRWQFWEQRFQTAPKDPPAGLPPQWTRDFQRSLQQQEKTIRQQLLEQYRRCLALPAKNQAKLQVEMKDVSPSEEMAVQQAVRFVRSITHKKQLVEPKVIVRRDEGLPVDYAEYDRNTKTVRFHFPKELSQWNKSTMCHELAHHLQHYIPGLHEAALEYRDRVTRGATLKWGGIQKTGEPWYYKERTDGRRWFHAYVGRVYFQRPVGLLRVGDPLPPEDRMRHEVVSMAIQQLYEDPPKLALEDPELFELVLSRLGGIRP